MDAREPRGFRIPLIRNARPVAKPLVQAGVVETLLYPIGAFLQSRPSAPLVGQIALRASRWHAILSRRCQKGPGDPSHGAPKCLRFKVSSYWHSCCSSDTRARGRRQKRHGGAVCGEYRGSVSGQDPCRR